MSISFALGGAASVAAPPLGSFRPLVRVKSGTERWPNGTGQTQPLEGQAEVWTEALQAALDREKTLRIPAREKPYCFHALRRAFFLE